MLPFTSAGELTPTSQKIVDRVVHEFMDEFRVYGGAGIFGTTKFRKWLACEIGILEFMEPHSVKPEAYPVFESWLFELAAKTGRKFNQIFLETCQGQKLEEYEIAPLLLAISDRMETHGRLWAFDEEERVEKLYTIKAHHYISGLPATEPTIAHYLVARSEEDVFYWVDEILNGNGWNRYEAQYPDGVTLFDAEGQEPIGKGTFKQRVMIMRGEANAPQAHVGRTLKSYSWDEGRLINEDEIRVLIKLMPNNITFVEV